MKKLFLILLTLPLMSCGFAEDFWPGEEEGDDEDELSCPEVQDFGKQNPIALNGRLAVTYSEESIDENQGDNHELAVFDLSTRKLRRLTNNLVNESELDISPDGKKILYTVRPELDDFNSPTEIWSMDFDGSNATQMLSGQPMAGGAWIYPAGLKFLFMQWQGEDPSKIFLFDPVTRVKKAFAPHLEGVGDIEFSRDGSLITFKMAVDGDRDFQPSVYVMNSDGTGVRRLTQGFSDHDPVFSADGKKVYFERYYGPGDWFDASMDRDVPEHNWWGIVEVDVAAKVEKILVPHDTCGRHLFWLPTVSPDGKSLMYIHNDTWAEDMGTAWSDLWVAGLGGENQQKVQGSDGIYFFDWAD